MTLTKLVVLLILMAAGFLLGLLAGRLTSHAPTVQDGTFHAGLTIEQLSDLSELLIIRIDVSDVLVSTVQGRTGGVQAVLLVKGDVTLGVDLSAARFERVDKANRVALLVLPKPGPSRPRLDHDRTRTVLLRKQGLWVLSPAGRPYAAAVDRAMTQAQGLVNTAGSTAEADRRARSHAESVLNTFFRALDWNVHITWADHV